MDNALTHIAQAPTRGARMRLRRLAAVVGVLSLLVAGTVVGQPADAAFAAGYPSWGDVQAARASVTAKQAEIQRLDSLLSSLGSAVATAQDLANKKGEEFQVAQHKLDEAGYKASELQSQADAAKTKADGSKQQAGQLAAQLAKAGGGGDLSTNLFFSGDDAKDLLAQLGLASVVKDRSASVYEKATQDENSARAMTNQATLAKDALKELAATAQTALDAANAASDKANALLQEQEANKPRLEAQRASLASNVIVTEASYNDGVAAAAAAAKAAAAAAAKAAADWAAAHPAQSTPAGDNNGSGWALPARGPISSGYGSRISPCSGCSSFHGGVDIAGGCNSPIYAASAGTVSYASRFGGYGNFILINHGGGLSTGYGHIVDGGILVRVGQSVSAGQQIARIGSTGNSTGCHLHFETRPGGVASNPVTFMAARGVRIG